MVFHLRRSQIWLRLPYMSIRAEAGQKKKCWAMTTVPVSILTVSCDDQVASPEFTVTGLGEPSAEIRLYLNGTLLTTVTALKNGTYRAAVTIPDPVSGAAYILEARNGADESQRAQTVFRYDDTAPELTEFKLYYNNHRDTELDLLNAQTKQYVSFNPKVPFTFTVRFDDGGGGRTGVYCQHEE